MLDLSRYHRPETKYLQYQEEAIYHLASNRSCLCSIFVGGGKTLISLSMFAYLAEFGHSTKCVFVTKKSVAQQVIPEVDKFFRGVSRFLVYEDSKPVRVRKYKEFFAGNGDPGVLVITYENLKFDLADLYPLLEDNANRFMLVLDEASVFKNNKTAAWKSVSRVTRLARKVVALTGTPIMNRLEDVYNICQAFGWHGISLLEFNRDHCVWTTQMIWMKKRGMARAQKVPVPMMSGYKNIDRFYAKISKLFFSKKKRDVVDLPPLFLSKISLSHSESTTQAMRELYLDYGKSVPYNVAVSALAAPAYVTQDFKSKSEKIQAVLDVLSEIDDDERVIIYSPFKQPLLCLEKHLPEKPARIFGDTRDRRAEVMKLASGKNRILMMTDAGSQGVDGLQVCNHIIFFILPVVAGTFIQVCGRISRVNTVHKDLHIYVPMIEDSVDDDLWCILQNQLILMKEISPDSIEDGIVDGSVSDPEVKGWASNASSWVRMRIENRCDQYTGKKVKACRR